MVGNPGRRGGSREIFQLLDMEQYTLTMKLSQSSQQTVGLSDYTVAFLNQEKKLYRAHSRLLRVLKVMGIDPYLWGLLALVKSGRKDIMHPLPDTQMFEDIAVAFAEKTKGYFVSRTRDKEGLIKLARIAAELKSRSEPSMKNGLQKINVSVATQVDPVVFKVSGCKCGVVSRRRCQSHSTTKNNQATVFKTSVWIPIEIEISPR
ncbi:hypothetical protein TWF694_006318 [Orbilia ellipsospora]|uniref:LAGLIDADG endonuclease n=1 Tax=Orbilia ellipsospora TaxID=2528407 RepID=A0AAV9XK40_9PEZI